MPPWNATKAKVQLRLAVQRLRTLQEKKEAQAKSARRDIATLLEKAKVETARIKVENIINEDIYLELLELLELYSELLIARFGLLDNNAREPDPGVSEAINAVIYAAPRTELKELHVLRDLLMHKFGREYSSAVMENRDNCVSDRIARKLRVEPPSSELVDAYLAEIAKAYGVDWAPSAGNDDIGDGGLKEAPQAVQPPDSSGKEKALVVADIAVKPVKGPTPEPTLPDVPPTEEEVRKPEAPAGKSDNARTPAAPPTVDEFEALRRRFEALKKR
ncbi:DUF292-domain-containing protein [Punctularia strigosozonata HHB-11173 SS5]|uniref:DUF292-domain-containing protein n=1 Tax=Punctularia strigosozonata (strain HHB-11173) TaxID=741275 RepID=UPI0004417DAA|nr:DUF292-domain-containing protein [Punctularia strigosozonata HHB-11173 SS5]EIN14381.1 DUF292-domain-containing protein [Punctularia strigosozonata HHB-11173 SS5]